ncbi:MAG: acyl-CoA thioesterase, partial [Pyrinomonadaceae bacterium]
MKEKREKSKWFETRIRVRYAETDCMGVVYHANYLVWFEIGRTEYC